MHGLNRTFIMGFLGSDPQSHSSQQGAPYTALSIATHRRIGATEDRREATDWHYVRVWGKQGESCAKFLKKGHPVFIEGYLTQYSQAKDDGKTERRTGINALRVDFLPRGQRAFETNALAEVGPEGVSATDDTENQAP